MNDRQTQAAAHGDARWKLAVLFLLHGGALGLYGVSLSTVLRAHGYEDVIKYVFATTSVAALISPLFIGALADHRFSTERLLRWLGVGATVFLALLFWAIHRRWSPWAVVVVCQIYTLWNTPTFGLTTSLVLSRITDAKQQFGLLRLWATVGWMAAGWIVSWALDADESPVSGWAACVGWTAVILFTFTLSPQPPAEPARQRSWREILGLDALHLLRHRDHGIVFITAALINIPIAAFYPFTVLHLQDLGVRHPTAAMTLGQVTEVLAMLLLSTVLSRFRLKWIFLSGIGFGVLRYALFALDSQAALLSGIFLHGLCYTLYTITAQIYLEDRIPAAMRSRAQALLVLMTSGIGSLAGTLGCGWWLDSCKRGARTADWPLYWTGLALAMAAVFAFFAIAYRGRGTGLRREPGSGPG